MLDARPPGGGRGGPFTQNEEGEEDPRPGTSPKNIPLWARVSAAIRLKKRILLCEGKQSIGLASLSCDPKKCRDSDKQARGCRRFGNTFTAQATSGNRIDWHEPSLPTDCPRFCPRSIPGIDALSSLVYRLIEIRDLGGLDRFYKAPIHELPERIVVLYQAALAAESRFAAQAQKIERDMVKAKLELAARQKNQRRRYG